MVGVRVSGIKNESLAQLTLCLAPVQIQVEERRSQSDVPFAQIRIEQQRLACRFFRAGPVLVIRSQTAEHNVGMRLPGIG